MKSTEAARAVAYYEFKPGTLAVGGSPPQLSVSADSELLCVEDLSHRVTFSWKVTADKPPVTLMYEVIYPSGSIQTTGLKPLNGSNVFSVNSERGGQVKIKVIATGSNGAKTSSDSTVQLKPCR